MKLKDLSKPEKDALISPEIVQCKYKRFLHISEPNPDDKIQQSRYKSTTELSIFFKCVIIAIFDLFNCIIEFVFSSSLYFVLISISLITVVIDIYSLVNDVI